MMTIDRKLPEKWTVIAVQNWKGQWELQPFAPFTLAEANTMRDAGLVLTVQRRADDGAMEILAKATQAGLAAMAAAARRKAQGAPQRRLG